MSFKVLVNTIDKIENFVGITRKFHYDIDLLVGRDKYLDGKSLMGILSCNIKEPMTVIVNCDDESEKLRLKEELSEYVVA